MAAHPSRPGLPVRRAVACGLLLAACAAPPSEPSTSARPTSESTVRFTLDAGPADASLARELEPVLRAAAVEVERFFGAPFLAPFRVVLCADRAAFDASFPPEWGMGRTECWMVASGVADSLRILSPRVWRTEACEHDPGNALHVRNLLAHELVHVFHGQRNPSPDFTGVQGIDWFVEGLATHASGQLASGEQAPAREALERGKDPASLAQAWSGRYRYGVSGSLVAYLDERLGRERLFRMLAATGPEELRALVGMEDPALLGAWRDWVLRSGGTASTPRR